ncbi:MULTISPECIES: CGNR zinc finger domain-containing protein [Streptomyces]|uniref:CGNR zinc finger domain-containing protein n=2 Tax=Streptomyces TaxID=1883 RepID=A0A3Q9FUW6_STRLT|nr:CGNR zinc finger domain-containing protein [Streptomyces luteoverticillatus]AZQ70797.1 CGNR zinc finger domain-containing protein [Streptomyces luteoverticillatus]
MLINHDTRRTLDSVVDLLNTDLDGLPALRGFAERHEINGIGALGEQDLAAVRSIRDRLTQVFDAPAAPTAAGLLNALVAEAGTTPRLTNHDGHPWHVHYFAPGASLAEHLAADGGMALAFLLVEGELERLRRCAAPGCGRAFVDLSRNRSRRYCDGRTCGNRLHVAAYRARRREAGD